MLAAAAMLISPPAVDVHLCAPWHPDRPAPRLGKPSNINQRQEIRFKQLNGVIDKQKTPVEGWVKQQLQVQTQSLELLRKSESSQQNQTKQGNKLQEEQSFDISSSERQNINQNVHSNPPPTTEETFYAILNELKAAMEKQNAAMDEQSKLIKDLGTEVSDLRTTVQQQNERIDKQNKTIDSQKMEIEDLKKQVKEVNSLKRKASVDHNEELQKQMKTGEDQNQPQQQNWVKRIGTEGYRQNPPKRQSTLEEFMSTKNSNNLPSMGGP